jgi:molybdopterin molybdotransferase
MNNPLKSVDDVQAELIARAPLMPVERVSLLQAAARVLSTDVRAARALPPFDNSAMDGFGAHFVDVEHASEQAPVTLPVVRGNRADGQAPAAALSRGHCMPIMTGAPISAGVDVVLMREHVEEHAHHIVVRQAPRAAQHIRLRGEDVEQQGLVAEAGTRIHPAALNAMLAAGIAQVDVRRAPRVVVFATGDEIVDVGAPYSAHHIINSNAHAVLARLQQASYTAVFGGVLRDSLEAHADALARGAKEFDVVVSIGGVSVGTHDFVRPALQSLDFDVAQWKVAMRPGKPLAFAVRRSGDHAVCAMGLPGNPVSTMVTMELFLLPLLRAAEGDAQPLPFWHVATWAGAAFHKQAGLSHFVRVHASAGTDRMVCSPVGGQGSHQIRGMAQANALARIDSDVTTVNEGDAVRILWLR